MICIFCKQDAKFELDGPTVVDVSTGVGSNNSELVHLNCLRKTNGKMSDIVDLTNIHHGLIVYIEPRDDEYFARGTLNGKWTNSIGRGTSKLDSLERFLSALNDVSSWVDA